MMLRISASVRGCRPEPAVPFGHAAAVRLRVRDAAGAIVNFAHYVVRARGGSDAAA